MTRSARSRPPHAWSRSARRAALARNDGSFTRSTSAATRAAEIARIEAFLVIPPEHRETVRVRLVMDAVAALFQRERAVLEG